MQSQTRRRAMREAAWSALNPAARRDVERAVIAAGFTAAEQAGLERAARLVAAGYYSEEVR